MRPRTAGDSVSPFIASSAFKEGRGVGVEMAIGPKRENGGSGPCPWMGVGQNGARGETPLGRPPKVLPKRAGPCHWAELTDEAGMGGDKGKSQSLQKPRAGDPALLGGAEESRRGNSGTGSLFFFNSNSSAPPPHYKKETCVLQEF